MLIGADRRQPAAFQCPPGIRLRLQMGCVGHGPTHPICLPTDKPGWERGCSDSSAFYWCGGAALHPGAAKEPVSLFPTSASSGAPGTLWSLFSFASVYRTPYRTVISVTSTQTVSVPYLPYLISMAVNSSHSHRDNDSICAAAPRLSNRWWQRG